jgi:CDP-glycerol glycerophosphotransferase
MPRISVVVPIYNVEEYLPACLDSVARQTVDDFEVVMVNDGSTDRSAEIAGQYGRRDPRFRLVQQENAGLSAARNTGIDAATGEFIAFLDSDDVLPPNAYELLLGALDETGSDFATGNVHRLTGWSTSQSAFLAKTPGTSYGGARSGTSTASGSPRACCTRTSRSSCRPSSPRARST